MRGQAVEACPFFVLWPAGHQSDGNSHGGQFPIYFQSIGGELPWSGINLILRLASSFR